MQAAQCNLLKLLQNARQFVIPIYQRSYSWKESDCRQLWEDILRAGEENNPSEYFVGSIVYIDEGVSQNSNRAPSLVIDGQQRLTTVTLLLKALARNLSEGEELLDECVA
jgi:uncharacterized protein with ParB-like and HNH nuclease domain